jgi:AraC-like DNA-binding protein
MRFQISTDDVAERDRFAVWAAALHSAIGLNAQPLPDASGPFRARLSGRRSGALLYLNVAAAAHRVARRPRDIAQSDWGGYWIYREAAAGAWFSHAGREFVSRTGDLVVYDADVPFETRPSDNFVLEGWLLPKALLDPHLPASGRPLTTTLSGRTGLDVLAGSYLNALTENWDSIDEASMARVADTLGRLIGVACGAAAAAQPDAVRAGRLAQAKQQIVRHLADPDLSPVSVAAALGISVRALHLSFEPTGVSFARHVLRCRLEECRAALLANPARQVTDIAFGWGFSSLSAFYRAFQDALGLSPGELRAASREAHRS